MTMDTCPKSREHLRKGGDLAIGLHKSCLKEAAGFT